MGSMMTGASELALQEINLQLDQMWRRPPRISITEWAKENRVLTKAASARPGPFRPQKYQVEILNCVTQPAVKQVTLRASTQVGKSEILNNVMGYYIDSDPKPIMMVQPNLSNAKDYSKKKIAPMIEACEVLRAKIREATSRRPGNTMLLKEFDEGFLKITGANSGPGLRSDQIAILLLDEIEAYPLDVNGEGDPIEIAERRTDSYDDAKILMSSTPARPRGFCRIDSEYEESSQGIFYVPCPMCDFMQELKWRNGDGSYNLIYTKNDRGTVVMGTVFYVCAGCKENIDEKFKQRMIDRGEWRHKYPERLHHRGFHINALYSPWKENWADLADQWLKAQGNPELLKGFINLRLGESWNEGSEEFKLDVLQERREVYIAEVPAGVGVLVAACDLQQNRIECDIWGFGREEEAWLISHDVFYGDPSASGDPETGESVWTQLDAHLLREWKTFHGLTLRPAITFIDSGAHSDAVYDYVTPRQNTIRRIFASKGMDFLSRPGLSVESTAKNSTVRLFMVATHAAKDRIFSRLRIAKPGPSYIHFGGPLDEEGNAPGVPTDEWISQLVSEKRVIQRDKRTRGIKTYYVKVHLRNEALDMAVYAYAALFALQRLDPARYKDLGAIGDSLAQGKPLAQPPQRQRRVRSPGVPNGGRLS